MKLRLSHIDLSDSKVVEMIQELIVKSEAICHLDLSWSSLSPQHMANLLQTMIEHPHKIRHLNLSFNFVGRDKQEVPKPGKEAP